MKQYAIYLPASHNDGTPVDPEKIEELKATLAKAFGGYTHQKSRSEGAWRVGGVLFRDEITVLRVLDSGGGGFDMRGFQRRAATLLNQETILIVQQVVEVLE